MEKNKNFESIDAMETEPALDTVETENAVNTAETENAANAAETENAKNATELEKNEEKTWFGREMVTLFFLLAVSAFTLIMSVRILLDNPGGASPGLFPTICSVGMVICLLSAILQACKKITAEKKAAGPDAAVKEKGWESFKVKIVTEVPFTVFVMIAAALLYAVLLTFIGFYISTGLYLMFSIAFLYRGTHWKQAVFVTAGFLLAIFLIIELLFKVPMP